MTLPVQSPRALRSEIDSAFFEAAAHGAMSCSQGGQGHDHPEVGNSFDTFRRLGLLLDDVKKKMSVSVDQIECPKSAAENRRYWIRFDDAGSGGPHKACHGASVLFGFWLKQLRALIVPGQAPSVHTCDRGLIVTNVRMADLGGLSASLNICCSEAS